MDVRGGRRVIGGLAAARAQALAFLTVDHTDMDPALDAVLAGATGDFAEQYAAQRETLTATTSQSRVLVFVNQSTDGEDLDEPTLDLDRVLVTLVRTRGEWKVSELDAL